MTANIRIDATRITLQIYVNISLPAINIRQSRDISCIDATQMSKSSRGEAGWWLRAI